MQAMQTELRGETTNLVKALRAPSVRGRWGEIQLKRVVEMAGMLEHCDFVQQASVETDAGRRRPDLVVRLPGGRCVAVDSKTPLEHYLNALDAPDEASRVAALQRHAAQVRKHIAELSSKAYWEAIGGSPEFVVLFLPGETFFSAALEHDPTLIEAGAERQVILATPTTLIALLRAVAYGWRQEQLASNAREISEAGRRLHDRVGSFVEHLVKLGTALERAVGGYNAAVGSLEARVLPSARELRRLGASGGEEIPPLSAVQREPRIVALGELTLPGLAVESTQAATPDAAGTTG
jgi:DNA recombination protein RmuC